MEISNRWDARLLRLRREWQGRRCAAEEGSQLASLNPVTFDGVRLSLSRYAMTWNWFQRGPP
jgi:hypothetical protein